MTIGTGKVALKYLQVTKWSIFGDIFCLGKRNFGKGILGECPLNSAPVPGQAASIER